MQQLLTTQMTKAFKWSILGTIYRLVYNNTKNNIIYVRASCWASDKRNVKYKMKMICNHNGTPKILAAKCDRQLSGFQQWVQGKAFPIVLHTKMFRTTEEWGVRGKFFVPTLHQKLKSFSSKGNYRKLNLVDYLNDYYQEQPHNIIALCRT